MRLQPDSTEAAGTCLAILFIAFVRQRLRERAFGSGLHVALLGPRLPAGEELPRRREGVAVAAVEPVVDPLLHGVLVGEIGFAGLVHPVGDVEPVALPFDAAV